MKFETQFTWTLLADHFRRVRGACWRSVVVRASWRRVSFAMESVSSPSIVTPVLSPRLTRGALTLESPPGQILSGLLDTLLFTRSLHHVHPLGKAVQRAADVLVIGGRLIVEDFAYEATDENTLRWFGEVIDRLDHAGVLIKGDGFLKAVRSKTETLKTWRENHESNLHTAAAIRAEIRRVFGEVRSEEVPYYFRCRPGNCADGRPRQNFARFG